MKYGYHYTPCDSSCSGPGLWLLLKLSVILGTAAGVWWVLKAIGRALSAAATAATEAGPAVFAIAGVIAAAAAVAVVTFVVRNNQRPPLIPHDRPARQELDASTVEVIDVIPNRKRLNPPRPAYQTYAYQTFATPEHATMSR